MIRLLLIITIFSSKCFGQAKFSNDNLPVDSSVNLYAFVGQKIKITEFDPNAEFHRTSNIEIDSTTGDTILGKRTFVMDHAFEAKYKVLKSVFNDLKVDTITFKAYDHYGRPNFENYNVVLLYISKSQDGKYFFHQKYQFDTLVFGKHGIWRGENGKSLKQLFNTKKRTVFKERGLFTD